MAMLFKGLAMRDMIAIVASMLTMTVVSAREVTPSVKAEKQAPAEAGVRLQSLKDLTIAALRARHYGSTLRILADLATGPNARVYAERFFGGGPGPYSSVLASYQSDGLRLYARLDVPHAPPPPGGYPVIVFLHGWVGYEAAKDFHFSYTPDSMYAEMIDAYAKAGFVVVTPGYRGHGTVNGQVAGGRASMAAWDNATHIAPILYAIDSLNLIDGLSSIKMLNFQDYGRHSGTVSLNLKRLYVSGHSQGGDVALTVLAVAGHGSKVVNRPRAGSIMSGTFPDRFTQVETFRPMAESSEAFLAGDGTWTGSARGRDGTVNPNFVFGWPSDSIETPDPREWTWQKGQYGEASVRDVVVAGYSEMYRSLSQNVSDLGDANFSILEGVKPKGYKINHDPRVASMIQDLGGFYAERFISARVALHFSDRDYYSLPRWNYDLCARIARRGGYCKPHEYIGGTHTLRLSSHGWFSPAGSHEPYAIIIKRDLALFR
ncbi:alpha/beta hydrolase [Novosphingobium fuchskuhlense]